MDRYQEVREYVNERINDIDNMKFYEHKVICLCSLVDTFVQNYGAYKNANRESFRDFILKYCDKSRYSYLTETDPITLSYDMDNKPSLFKELSSSCIYTPKSAEIKLILKKMNLSGKEKLKKDHSYIDLIWKNRSKVTHEGQSAGLVHVDTENEYNTPIYFDYTSYWALIFPYEFLKELFLNCINNYLEKCKNDNLDPFKNNVTSRKSLYAFYDEKRKKE